MTRLAMPALGLAILLAVPVYAQAPARAFADRSIAGTELVSATAAVADLMDRGSELARAGSFRKAAHVYHAAATAQLRAGALPGAALWQEANMYFAVGDNARAAAALESLGNHASDFGDPVAEVRAKMNAALLYAKSGHVERAAALATELQTLRKSPFIGDALRNEVDLRLGRK